MSLEYFLSTQPPCLSGENNQGEDEVSSGTSRKKCDEICTNEDGNEANKNSKQTVEEPKEGMEFDTSDEAYIYYSTYAKEKGFVVSKRNSRKGSDGKLMNLTFQCNRGRKAKVTTINPVKPRPQTKIECPDRLNLSICRDGRWRLNKVALEHNHINSPGKSRFYKSYRVVDEHVKRKLELNDKAGINLHKTYDSLQIEAGGHENLSFFPKDCQNHLYKMRRQLLVEGDAEAMHNYFMKMKANNSEFFFAVDLDDEGRLRNVFWVDARSRAACKEFGDVVTFDTTYLVNKYDMPFAPFVGVNHHGQSILLGCGLISHEDTKSFSWLFKTWMTCMWGCTPIAIITDQCMAMKIAIQEVFPNTRHRWCIWHILKKVPEKLENCKAYKSISSSLHNAIYDSLTVVDFENAWDVLIKKYELQNNDWLHGLYLERNRWVPTFVKDVFWTGMSSTQRSESMNSYFDGYINSMTTLKQFVEQYENALAKKVEIKKHEDAKSLHSYIPCITEDELETQFQSVYTNAKFKEFQKLFVGRLKCEIMSETKVDDVRSTYEVEEDITFGEEKRRRRVSFIVDFNSETNEANCNCRLFEFKGMMCQHQLAVFHKRRVERVPEKYVLRRWRKDVKRVHTKVRINYDNSSSTIEARRHDNICSLFNEVADLAEDSEEKYENVIGRIRELKIELLQSSVVCGSNLLSATPNASSSLGDVAIPSKESRNILDPKAVTRKGRLPTTRKQGVIEKMYKNKREPKKKTKDVDRIVDLNVFGTQDSVVHVNGGPSFAHQHVVYNPQMAPMHSSQSFFHPNGHQYGQQMIVGQPGQFFYMPT
ncbi:protein FAR1-RELATED SEQUENCE 6-like [Actinidia eriantha]|uniref:protein FAR1-RELATED SEQUENCE 6-like n=1 Tax=Actinidia eriantha TaxID=165200 RepID=UPI0025841D39|nr:protein FAR1-RELATED SEQUENCE 6-like [Actinidia eriantha]